MLMVSDKTRLLEFIKLYEQNPLENFPPLYLSKLYFGFKNHTIQNSLSKKWQGYE